MALGLITMLHRNIVEGIDGMERLWWLHPSDSAELLRSVLRELSAGSRVALEGEKRRVSLISVELKGDQCSDPPPPFTREWGKDGYFRVLPLNGSTVSSVTKALLENNAFQQLVGSIQIEKGGSVEFVAGDGFHPECISAGSALSRDFLEHLVGQGILKGYTSASRP